MYLTLVPNEIIDKVDDKKILYSDIKSENCSNYEETEIDVKINDLKECIINIVLSNPNVRFNSIRYTKNSDKVYFYTDKLISTKVWEEKHENELNQLYDKKNLLEELKKIIDFDVDEFIENQNTMVGIDKESIISLHSVRNLIKQKDKFQEEIKRIYNDILKEKLGQYFYFCNVIVYGFNSENRELSIGFTDIQGGNLDKIIFSKKDDDLYIKDSFSYRGKEVFYRAINELNDLFNIFDSLTDFLNADTTINILNSNLYARIIGNLGVKIQDSKDYYSDFILNCFRSTNYAECNSGNVLSLVSANEEKILKNSYVYIKDCPICMKEELIKIRKRELEYQKNKKLEQQQIEEAKKLEKQQIEETNKQEEQSKENKKLRLKRKLFPFLKEKYYFHF